MIRRYKSHDSPTIVPEWPACPPVVIVIRLPRRRIHVFMRPTTGSDHAGGKERGGRYFLPLPDPLKLRNYDNDGFIWKFNDNMRRRVPIACLAFNSIYPLAREDVDTIRCRITRWPPMPTLQRSVAVLTR